MKIRYLSNCITLLVMVLSQNTYALTYPWKVVTSVVASRKVGGGTTFTFTLANTSITDDSISDTDKYTDVYNRKTGHNEVPGSLGVVAWATMPGATYAAQSIIVSTDSTTNFKDYAANYAALSNSYSSYIVQDFTTSDGVCAQSGLVPIQTIANGIGEAIKQSTWNPANTEQCITVTPPPPLEDTCSMSTNSVTFAYGTLALQSAQGTESRNTISISCTAAKNFKLSLSGSDPIPLTNGMTANITANGKALNTTLAGVSGSNSVELVSKLAGTPSKAGSFSGSGVLTLSFP